MVREIRVTTVEELFDTLRLSNTRLWGNSYPSEWLFRGQADANWQLLPSLWRQHNLDRFAEVIGSIESNLDFCRDRIHRASIRWIGKDVGSDKAFKLHAQSIFHYEMINEFRYFAEDLALLSSANQFLDHGNWTGKSAGGEWYFRYPQAGGIRNIELISLAQHSGMPTCMLDWTLDPIKALVFATENEEKDNPAIWAVNRKWLLHNNFQTIRINPHPDYHVKFNFYDPPRRENINANFQDGVLMYITEYENYVNRGSFFPDIAGVIEDYTGSIGKDLDDVLVKIVLVKNSKLELPDVVNRLFRERKTLSHLMPNFETCARTAMKSIKNNMKGKF